VADEPPEEILAVIDVTDTVCIDIAREYPDVTVIVTSTPGSGRRSSTASRRPRARSSCSSTRTRSSSRR
jgi:hypothetical protein